VDVPLLIERLRAAYPDAATALHHQNAFELLIATILSAQCTDARVNMVTPVLFARFPDPAAMMRASQEELEGVIRSTGFYRNKSKAIRAASARIVEEFGGDVPRTMEELLRLPGVARKTANVVLGSAYGVAEGVVVDTHVYRLSRRLGLSQGKTAEDVERDLTRIIPREDWILFAHLLIFHGRQICQARRPKCPACPVNDLCPSATYFLSGTVPPWESRGETRRQPERDAARKKAERGGASKRPARDARKNTVRAKPASRAARKRAAIRKKKSVAIRKKSVAAVRSKKNTPARAARKRAR
jgi:endonuclease III